MASVMNEIGPCAQNINTILDPIVSTIGKDICDHLKKEKTKNQKSSLDLL